MASRGVPAVVAALPEGIDDFEHKTFSIRGTEYQIRELAAEEYDACVSASRREDESLDAVLLLRLMMLRSIKSPILTAESLSKLPYRVVRKLSEEVNELHYRLDDEEPIPGKD